MGIYDGAGIHGTDASGSIGTAASHGCIRMRIPEVIELYDQVPVGAPDLHRLSRVAGQRQRRLGREAGQPAAARVSRAAVGPRAKLCGSAAEAAPTDVVRTIADRAGPSPSLPSRS